MEKIVDIAHLFVINGMTYEDLQTEFKSLEGYDPQVIVNIFCQFVPYNRIVEFLEHVERELQIQVKEKALQRLQMQLGDLGNIFKK